MFVPCAAPCDVLIQRILEIVCDANSILEQEYRVYCGEQECFDIQRKEDNSPVTQADLKSNAFILQKLAQLTPEIPVLSEENDATLRHQWEKCWLLDPLDGTKEFLKKRPEFTINLSLIEHGKTIFSVIAVPAQRLVYLGYTHQMPYKYVQDNQQWLLYQQTRHLFQHHVKLGLSHRSRKTEYQSFLEILQHSYSVASVHAGSAYKFCMMLEGEIDLYPRFHPTCEWDTSAGQGLLESIGGGLISLDGQPFTYNQRETLLNDGFIAFMSPEGKALGLRVLDEMIKSQLL